MSEQEALKVCPFCGEGFTDCGSAFIHKKDNCILDGTIFRWDSDYHKKWNTRAALPTPLNGDCICDNVKKYGSVIPSEFTEKLIKDMPMVYTKESNGDIIERMLTAHNAKADGVEYWSNATLMRAALAASGLLPEWQPIETAPQDGTYILGFCIASKSICLVNWYEEDKAWKTEQLGWYGSQTLSHWMPLPPKPKSEV